MNVRRFAYFFAWISFIFRPIVLLVLWKDSLDFRKIIRHKNKPQEPGATSSMDASPSNPELELQRIMAQFSNV